MTYFLLSQHSMLGFGFKEKHGREHWKIKQQTVSSEIQLLAILLLVHVSSTTDIGGDFETRVLRHHHSKNPKYKPAEVILH